MGAPIAAVVQPGECHFTEEWTPAPLLSVIPQSHNTKVLSFGLPEGKALGLPTCACILARAPGGKLPFKPYTPISTNAMLGKFEILIKVYDEGTMTQFFDKLEVGQVVEFSHANNFWNVKLQYVDFKPKVGMLCGGTGIAPMLQALQAILGNPGDQRKVSMVYGNRTVGDILCHEDLMDWARSFQEKFTIEHVLSAEPEGSAWTGARGHINRDLIARNMPPPGDDCVIFVCGPLPMYEALCGAPDMPGTPITPLTGLLAEMGYTTEMVIKF